MICDVCGKIIYRKDHGGIQTKQDSNVYYEVSCIDRGLGNDAVDPMKSFDWCSAECAEKGFRKYLDHVKEEPHLESEITIRMRFI